MGVKANAIREHNAIHSLKEERAIKISRYLSEAADLMELYEHGLLLRLPCKVGDTVWVVITSYVYGEIGDPPETRHHIEKRSFELSMLDEFGKTIFLAREEAEASLTKEE